MRERFTPSADAKARPPPTIALAAYPGTSNRVETVTRGAQTVRFVAEAIVWHGGEAQAARDAFAAMTKSERRALVAFVNSL